MRYFVFDLLAALAIAFLSTGAYAVHQWRSGAYLNNISNSEVFFAARNCRTQFDTRTIVLGDSVANQLFSNRVLNTEPQSLTSNGSVTMAGHYLLARQAIERNPQIERIVLILHPQCLGIDLRNWWAFHLFAKPFAVDGFSPDMHEVAHQQLDELPFVWLVNLPQVRVGNWSPPQWFFQNQHDEIFPLLTRVSLMDFIQTCRNQSIEFTMIAPPVSPSQSNLIDRLKTELIEDPDVGDLMRNYFASIRYAEEDAFCDGMHLNKPMDFLSWYIPFFDEPLSRDDWRVHSLMCRCQEPLK